MADRPMDAPGPGRLDNRAVAERLATLDEQLAQLESSPGPIGELALTAVSGLAEIYGQALARALDLVDPALVDQMLGDELIGHLLVLHGLHPTPLRYRTTRAIEGLRTGLSARGAEVELVGIDQGVAILRLSGKGCGMSATGIEQAVRDAVQAAVPELSAVTFVPAERASRSTFVSLNSVMRAVPSSHRR